jgi:hypothetical protein
MSIAPLIDPLGSVLLVVGVASVIPELAEALEKFGSQDLDSGSAEEPTMKIAKAITGSLIMHLVCIFFLQCPFISVSLNHQINRIHM